jgi:hypothetical protein
MGKLFRLLLLIASAPFVYAFAVEAFVFVRASVTAQDITWFLIGLVFCVVIYAVLPHRSSKTIQFIETFRHEAAHATVSILFLKMPQTFSVDVSKAEAGEKGKTGPLRGWFLADLAPYYLPVLTLPLLLVKPVTPESMRAFVDLLIGVTLGFHYFTAIKDFHFKQKDIITTGRIFSTVMVTLFNIVWLVIILCVVTNNYAGIVSYFRSSVARGLDAYEAVLEVARIRLLPVLQRAWEAMQQAWEAFIEAIL